MSPQQKLCKAMFTINFLNCSFENMSPPVVHHFNSGNQFKLSQRPPVLIRDPEIWETKGPYELMTWSRGYACVATPSGPRWIPQKWVKPFVPKNPAPAEGDERQVAVASKRRRQKTYLTLNPVMNSIQVATLLMLNNLVMVWIVPQPCQNIWVTLAQTLQQKNMFVHCSSRESYVYLSEDEKITRQATLQNRAAIDFLLLLHGHECQKFEGLCCLNLTLKALDIHAALRIMNSLIGQVKQESEDWVKELFKG
ncbi:hypothetical protein HGM15179_022059 [Zosterops borbonicus]|uniref:Integrase-type domain-containing protein n=1 Tax=Zosterops borbonicus TaxID=364589 RepID=A0A8K1FTG4_9PASS|nr:hypothetical protein HGM15179_022059 [Zosterops borbonicus]